MSLWSSSTPLASATLSTLDPHRDSFWIPCCGSGSAGPASSQLQQVLGGADVGVGQLQVLDLGLGSGGVGQPARCPAPVPQGPTLLLCPGKRRGQLFLPARTDLRYH